MGRMIPCWHLEFPWQVPLVGPSGGLGVVRASVQRKAAAAESSANQRQAHEPGFTGPDPSMRRVLNRLRVPLRSSTGACCSWPLHLKTRDTAEGGSESDTHAVSSEALEGVLSPPPAAAIQPTYANILLLISSRSFQTGGLWDTEGSASARAPPRPTRVSLLFKVPRGGQVLGPSSPLEDAQGRQRPCSQVDGEQIWLQLRWWIRRSGVWVRTRAARSAGLKGRCPTRRVGKNKKETSRREAGERHRGGAADVPSELVRRWALTRRSRFGGTEPRKTDRALSKRIRAGAKHLTHLLALAKQALTAVLMLTAGPRGRERGHERGHGDPGVSALPPPHLRGPPDTQAV